MKLLELYSLNKRIVDDDKLKGTYVLGIDLNEKYEYKIFPVKYFDYVYSTPKTNEQLILTVRIIDYLKPKYWFIDYCNKNVFDKLDLKDAVSYEFKMVGKRKMLLWSNLKNWKLKKDSYFTVGDLLDALNVVYFK